jgi:ABC-2 type transport system ATP-binding protein
MAVPAIELENVSKSYGRVRAVQDLSLKVPAQSVYGFLGPNGAGKTTSIRLILGLQRADQGTIRLFGRSLAAERLELLRHTGAMVESPSLYSHLTGRENLEIHRRILSLPKVAIEEALRTVNLLEAADRVVRGYSLGMRQRLGIALALLANPELLVLDEPTNGLDPAGIHEIRNLIRELPQTRGVTVFLSSHLLSEVEQSATHVAILSQGRLLFEGTRDDWKYRSQPSLAIEVDAPARAADLLEKAGCCVNRLEGRILVAGPVTAADINKILVDAGIAVSHLAMQRPSLEDTFLELTREALV